jgi:hypothetical protein
MIKPSMPSKRIMFTLSPEDIRLIKLLSEQMGETSSQIVKRAVITLSHVYSAQGVKKIGEK